MVVAWFGAAGIAAIVSRYFKDGFMNSTDMSCGVKPWFQVKCVIIDLFTDIINYGVDSICSVQRYSISLDKYDIIGSTYDINEIIKWFQNDIKLRLMWYYRVCNTTALEYPPLNFSAMNH